MNTLYPWFLTLFLPPLSVHPIDLVLLLLCLISWIHSQSHLVFESQSGYFPLHSDCSGISKNLELKSNENVSQKSSFPTQHLSLPLALALCPHRSAPALAIRISQAVATAPEPCKTIFFLFLNTTVPWMPLPSHRCFFPPPSDLRVLHFSKLK